MNEFTKNATVQDIPSVIKDCINCDVIRVNTKGEEECGIVGFSPAPTSLLQAIERIDMVAEGSGLEYEALKGAGPEIEYVAKRVGISALQAVLLAVCVNRGGQNVEFSVLTEWLTITNAHALSLLDDFKKLERHRLVKISKDYDGINIALPSTMLLQLSRNKDFEYAPASNLDTEEFLISSNRLICRFFDRAIENEELIEEIQYLLDSNKKCSLVKELSKLKLSSPYRIMLIALCGALYNGTNTMHTQNLWFCTTDSNQFEKWKRELRTGTHDLMKKGLVEHASNNGIVDSKLIKLTKSARERLLKGVELASSNEDEEVGVIASSSIKPKELYYNADIAQRVDELTHFFEQDNYKSILEQMQKHNFRSAFTCLFYGTPGTGKTETVNQIARITGRDILLVDVPSLKDKWVGESEKNVKGVFDKYRKLVKRSKVTPILLFNEADSIFGKRMTYLDSSVGQMLNTMQNIILQEMETLEGILIATTNLTENLDSAFDRRFLYKIRFDRPGAEVRSRIWHNMIPELTTDEVETLAAKYDFSGGQIENVARKFTINSVLFGNKEHDRMKQLLDYCDNETIQDANAQMRRVGF